MVAYSDRQVLTLTANGVDTSPVIRGIWVLESLLGTPPSPPPPDVEPIDPDVRGAKTMKELWKNTGQSKPVRIAMQKLTRMDFRLNISTQWEDIAQPTTVPASGKINPDDTILSRKTNRWNSNLALEKKSSVPVL